MSVSWAHSPPEVLRRHHARDAEALAGALPGDVDEAVLPAAAAFRGGLLFTPRRREGETVVVYFHGGGFVAGSPATHRNVTAWLAHACGWTVLSARYRLAPEHPYPAQRDDALAAIRQACAIAGPAGVFLAGDSAGACVALWGYDSLSLSEREAVRGLVLFYGGFGLVESDSIARHGTAENGLDSATLRIMYARLDPSPGAAAPPWPHRFARGIAGPVLVVAAGLDAVLDDSLRLHRSLAFHPRSRLVSVDREDHGFLKRVGNDETAMAVIRDAASWMQNCTGDPIPHNLE